MKWLVQRPMTSLSDEYNFQNLVQRSKTLLREFMFVYVNLYLFICRSLHLSLSLSISISLSLYLSICLSVCLSVRLSIYLPVRLSNLSPFLSYYICYSILFVYYCFIVFLVSALKWRNLNLMKSSLEWGRLYSIATSHRGFYDGIILLTFLLLPVNTGERRED